MYTRTLVVAAILIATAVPSSAQVTSPTFDQVRSDAHRGETVYVTDLTGKTVKGRVLKISTTAIELDVRGAAQEWRTEDVRLITQRHRHAGRGALIGLGVGAALGVAAVMTDDCSGQIGCVTTNDAGWAALGAALIGGLGTAAGAGIGAAIQTERVLYAAPPSRPMAQLAPLVARGAVGMRVRVRF